MDRVRWGLLSTANINRRVIPAIRLSPRGTLMAVASRRQETADAYAAEWEIPRAFGSYEAMLASDTVDAVYISVPNRFHAEWAVRALQSGKHVLCEKPFALSLDDVDRMVTTAEETGLVLAEAFMYRHHPQTKIAGEWARSGRLGEVILVRATFNFSFHSRDNIRLRPELGGGSLWDVGIYPVSLAQFIMGETPAWVLGDQWLGSTGVDESFSGQLHYGGPDSGRAAQIACAFRSPWYTFAEIIGTEGRLTLNRPFVALNDGARQMLFHAGSGEIREVEVPDQQLYLGEIEDMHAAILDGVPTYLTLTETRHHVQTALALYNAAQKGQVVELEVTHKPAIPDNNSSLDEAG